MPVTRTRINKLSHSDTILYEIYMLRFTCARLIREQWENERDAWVYLESFLVHYRNLVEFFGNPTSKVTGSDIHITNLWGLEGQTAPSWVKAANTKGERLFARYEKQDDRISRYLHHCTTKRIDVKDWQIDVMVKEIEPLLADVEKALKPTNTLLGQIGAVPILGAHSASTATGTSTAVVAIPLKP